MSKKIKSANHVGARSTSNQMIIDVPLFYKDQRITASEANVIRLIPEGEDRKVSMPYLAQLSNTSTRVVQAIISSAKKKGVPILSSRRAGDSGYYIATTEDERQRGLANLRHQVKEITAGVEGVQSASLDNWKQATGYAEVINDE